MTMTSTNLDEIALCVRKCGEEVVMVSAKTKSAAHHRGTKKKWDPSQKGHTSWFVTTKPDGYAGYHQLEWVSTLGMFVCLLMREVANTHT